MDFQFIVSVLKNVLIGHTPGVVLDLVGQGRGGVHVLGIVVVVVEVVLGSSVHISYRYLYILKVFFLFNSC